MNKVIANLIRVFHAIFWLVLFAGVLISPSIKISTICTFIVMLGVMLWDVLGYCFLNMLENGMDPLRVTPHKEEDDPGVSYFVHSFSSSFNIKPRHITVFVNYMIYTVLFVGLLRVYLFLRRQKPT